MISMVLAEKLVKFRFFFFHNNRTYSCWNGITSCKHSLIYYFLVAPNRQIFFLLIDLYFLDCTEKTIQVYILS